MENLNKYPIMYAPTCDWPNCYNPMAIGICGFSDGYPKPSQWCDEHYKEVQKRCEKDKAWIKKFQKGKIRDLPKDERKIKVYAW